MIFSNANSIQGQFTGDWEQTLDSTPWITSSWQTRCIVLLTPGFQSAVWRAHDRIVCEWRLEADSNTIVKILS